MRTRSRRPTEETDARRGWSAGAKGSAPARRRSLEAVLRALVRRVIPDARISFPRRADRRVRYSWNGRTLRPTGLTLESVCHEIAHALVSAPERRGLPEFGLGPDPYRFSNAARVASEQQATAEED